VAGRTWADKRYLISPKDRPFMQIADAQSLSDYQMCYWYCLEMEQRRDLNKLTCAEHGLASPAIETAGLNDPKARSRMVPDLGLGGDTNVAAAHDANPDDPVFNATSAWERQVPVEIDFVAKEAAVRSRITHGLGGDDVEARIAVGRARVARWARQARGPALPSRKAEDIREAVT
jgi:hypothetical protein